MVYNEAEGYYPDKGGKLFGPTIKGIKEFSYYELTFTASTKEDCWKPVIQSRPYGKNYFLPNATDWHINVSNRPIHVYMGFDL